MRVSSGPLPFLRVCALVAAIVVTLGYYGHVRAQSSSAASGAVVIPLRPLAPLSTVSIPPVLGLEGIVADKTAAIELGKALFWDMQAGSDDIQACASCHFNAGADSRAINSVNPGQPGGDSTFQMGAATAGTPGPNYHYKAGTPGAGFGGYHDGDFPFHNLSNPDDKFSSVNSDVNDVSGSQGVFSTKIGQIITTTGTAPVGPGPVPIALQGSTVTPTVNTNTAGSTLGLVRGFSGSGLIQPVSPRTIAPTTPATVTDSTEVDTSLVDQVFSYPDPNNSNARINTRQVTGRNTPSVVDAVFNFRNFWDGRAQNICNGANPFGSRDQQSHLLIIKDGTLTSTFVNMQNSALCSQALGPILSSVEMSAAGRNFPQVGKKLLARTPLARQFVNPTDSVLGALSKAPGKGLNTSYTKLIQQAFMPEWWQFAQHVCIGGDGAIKGTVDPAQGQACGANTTEYSQMEFNFSLFWGVAIQMYESTLVADQTPMDKYLEQQQTYSLIGDNHSNSYTLHLKPGIDPYTVSVIQLDPTRDASDQDVYSFDDGFGRFIGTGLDGTIDYASGTMVLNFEVPPVSQIPIKIAYSVGPTPLTQGQLRGLTIFQTKGRCVVCHGGPELSNAAVDTVGPEPLERMIMGDLSVRVYDTGFYHIGVRMGAEDAGLGGADPVAGLPLSQAEYLRQQVCNGAIANVIVPGRRTEGISQAPMNCNDEIARTGFFKAPQLRNVALTAPYFHNGSQLTLEQVVEFYNRGADFNITSELSIMDPDIAPIGLTLQDKQDLVDFLRNGLTDRRTVVQAAPFDHPQLFTPNGHPGDANGYPVQSDGAHPGQATNQLMIIPATGRDGGKPLPTFLDNVLANSK